MCDKSTMMHSLWFMLSTLQETVVVVISKYWFYDVALVEVNHAYICVYDSVGTLIYVC